MESKKWCSTVLALLLATVLVFAGTIRYFDPLLQYGRESSRLSYYHSTEIYSNPGIAKNYIYDSVLVGSSMVENADVAEMDSLFGYTTVKLPYSGASSYNHKKILDVCFSSGNSIKNVFWDLDEYSLQTDSKTPRYPLPEYLYDENLLNDASYLLNADVAYFYLSKDIINTLRHRKAPAMKDGSWTSDTNIYAKENMLKTVEYPQAMAEDRGETLYQDNLRANLEENILPFIEGHPEVTFRFFAPPYSIAYWYNSLANGTLHGELYCMETAIGEILAYGNVEVYFFQNDESIITNLDNYKDYSHYSPDINSYMTKEMFAGSHKLTLQNYKAVIADFRAYLLTFDYQSFFEEQMHS